MVSGAAESRTYGGRCLRRKRIFGGKEIVLCKRMYLTPSLFASDLADLFHRWCWRQSLAAAQWAMRRFMLRGLVTTIAEIALIAAALS